VRGDDFQMKIDRVKRDVAVASLAGQTPRKIRDFCRTFHWHIFSEESIAHFFGKDITTELRKARLIKPSPEIPGRFVLSALGFRWSNVLFLPRFDRAKADRMVADMLARAAQINSDPDLVYWVDELHAFGSYATDTDDLGDIDLIIHWGRRPVPARFEDVNEWIRERARLAGKDDYKFSNWARTEVWRRLRARNPYLSFYGPEQREQLKKKKCDVIKCIYSRADKKRAPVSRGP
jgi:hypothetical protein